MSDGAIAASLNEVESLSAKAARGAGLGWGQAEDIGRAARWLAERQFDWAEALRRLLGSEIAPRRLASAFHLADRVAGARAGDPCFETGCDIIWTVPLLAQAMRGKGLTLTLRGAAITTRLRPGDCVSANVAAADLAALPPQDVTAVIEAGGEALPVRLMPKTRRSRVALSLWREFEALAARTYVPASPQSRAGAGAGASDND